MFLQGRAPKSEEKARITVNGAILPPLMHDEQPAAPQPLSYFHCGVEKGLVRPHKAIPKAM